MYISKAKRKDIKVLLSCLKSASRRQQLARAEFDKTGSDADRTRWISASNDASRWERDILAHIGLTLED